MRLIPSSMPASVKLLNSRILPGREGLVAENGISPKKSLSTSAAAMPVVACPET